MSKSTKETTKLPKHVHVINLGSKATPDFVLSETPADVLKTWRENGAMKDYELVGTYELVETNKMRLTEIAEVV